MDFYWKHLESVKKKIALVTCLMMVLKMMSQFLSLELPHAAKVNKARTETELAS